MNASLEVPMRRSELEKALHKVCPPGTRVTLDGWKGFDDVDSKVYVLHKVSHPL